MCECIRLSVCAYCMLESEYLECYEDCIAANFDAAFRRSSATLHNPISFRYCICFNFLSTTSLPEMFKKENCLQIPKMESADGTVISHTSYHKKSLLKKIFFGEESRNAFKSCHWKTRKKKKWFTLETLMSKYKIVHKRYLRKEKIDKWIK